MIEKPKGFFINVDGIKAHILGDPDMDEATEQAIRELVKCVYDKMASGKLEQFRNPRRKPKMMHSKWSKESEDEHD